MPLSLVKLKKNKKKMAKIYPSTFPMASNFSQPTPAKFKFNTISCRFFGGSPDDRQSLSPPLSLSLSFSLFCSGLYLTPFPSQNKIKIMKATFAFFNTTQASSFPFCLSRIYKVHIKWRTISNSYWLLSPGIWSRPRASGGNAA